MIRGRRASPGPAQAFTKAFDHKWMIAEPGGLFEGPSGKHSARVGELKIGACSVSRGTL